MRGEGRFKAGDVVRYDSELPDRWCREETAIVEDRNTRLIFVDTYWGSMFDSHILTLSEIDTAEVMFNLSNFREVARYAPWLDYHPDDRAAITSQHGLQRRRFVRIGAEPDQDTCIENAREAVRDAENKVNAATSDLVSVRAFLACAIDNASTR